MEGMAVSRTTTRWDDRNDLRDSSGADVAVIDDDGDQNGRSNERAESFEAEALPHLDIVYRVALRLAGDPDDGEDLVQQTMLKAYRGWDSYRRGTNARAWLLTILRNEAFILHRRRKRALKARATKRIEGVTVQERGYGVDPETRFFGAFVADEVIRAVDSLPMPFREAIVLRYVENLSYAEIAQVTSVGIGTVKSRIFRGRRLLKRRLRDYAVRLNYIDPRTHSPEPHTDEAAG